MAEALLISRDDLVALAPLKGAVDPDKYTPFIKMAQDTHLAAILGTKLLLRVKGEIEASDISVDVAELLAYVRPCLAHYTLVEFLPWLVYTAANGGVFKHTPENTTTIDKTELDYLVEKERDTAEAYGRSLVAYIKANSTKFPEYLQDQGGQVGPISDETFIGWVL